MSISNFTHNQTVKVITAHNHIAADDTIYNIGSIDRIRGDISIVLLKDGNVYGAIPQTKLQAAK